jgi:catechol-2,3-dioxygenase
MRTADLPRLESFYAGLLGLTVLRRDDARGSVWLDADGTVLMLERASPGEPAVSPDGKELLAFALDDAAAREAWRTRLVVEAETEHTIYFRDPDGRRVALSTYPFR